MTHLIWFICIGWVGIHAEWRGTQQFPVPYWLYIICYMFNRILYIIYCYNYNLFDPTDLFCNILHFSCRISVKHHDLAKMWSHCWRSQIWIFHIMCRHNTVMFCRYRSFCVLVIKYKNLFMSIIFLLHLKTCSTPPPLKDWKAERCPCGVWPFSGEAPIRPNVQKGKSLYSRTSRGNKTGMMNVAVINFNFAVSWVPKELIPLQWKEKSVNFSDIWSTT